MHRASFVTGLEGYPVNTVSSANEPLSIPVRSDSVLYKREKAVLGRLMFDQIHKIKNELYGRLAGGLLEVQYAGLDTEVGIPLLKGRIMAGLSGSLVKKREPDNPFQMKDNDVKKTYSTVFVNTRLNIPEYEISIDVKAGRFLAGDDGVRITVSKFINGVIIWAWYSVTDTSVFTDTYNSGYHDKGIGVSIPLRLFKGADSRTAYNYTLSPWTRDAAQDIERYNTLFDFIGRNTKIFLDKDKKKMY
ncbi:MAG: YjbH domain-containing protein [Nitrospirae bacterium]|nr:YjbH domain-containing protein [Nitrospirota bacterium]